MDVRLLGPFEVSNGGAPIALGGRRQRAVLALLAMHVGQVVATDRIVEEIWAGEPPPSAVRTVHAYVSRLRAALRAGSGPEGPADVLRSRDPGYVLDLDPDRVDAVRFERGVTEGLRLLQAADPAGALDHLRPALALWRGTPLADFAYESFAADESRRLTERWLDGLELRIEAELALGDHRQVVAELESLVAEHPLRERYWAQLMVALYRSGRQSDALAVYGRVRRLLADELGLEPGAELQRLERLVLEQSPELAAGTRYDGTTAPPADAPAHRLPAGTPLPERLTVAPRVGVVGREDPLRAIAEAVGRVHGGGGGEILLVSGEAGQGKTTLVAEAARRAFGAGALVLSGHCEEEVAAPYRLFAEALGHWVAHAGLDELAAHVDAHGAELARMVPGLARRVPDLPPVGEVDPDAERVLLFAAVVDVVDQLARRQPCVLVFDDLQWADRGSLQLLTHLATAEQGAPLLVLGTYRDSELPTAAALTEALGPWSRHPRLARVELGGLTTDEVVSLMEAAAGEALGTDGLALAGAIHRETDGNPFFVTEVLRNLSETGDIYLDDEGHWQTVADLERSPLPAGVRDVIAARVIRLGEQAGADLSLASVIGREFDLDLLVAASGASDEHLLDVLDEAATAALVREVADQPGRYAFAHPLIQRTLYDAVGASRRSRLHRRVFEVLQRWRDEPGRTGPHRVPAAEPARHLLACAGPAELPLAVAYAREAAEEALAALSPDGAVRWYGAALEALGDGGTDAERAHLLARLGDAQRQNGELAHRQTLLDASALALEAGDTGTLVFAALANSRQIQSTTGEVDQERVATLEAALDRVGPAATPDRARLLAHLACDRTWDGEPERRATLIEESLAIAEGLGDDPTLLDVLLRRVGIWMPDDPGRRLAESARAEEIADRLGDPLARFWSLFYRSIVALEAGDRAELDRCRRRLPEEAEAVGQSVLRWVTAYARSWQEALDGDLAGAEAAATEALELGGATGQPDTLAIYGAQLLTVRWHQGRDDEIVELVEQTAAATPGIDSFRSALARIYADVDRPAEAAALLTAEAAVGFAHPADPLELTTLTMWAEAAVHLGDEGVATVLADRLAPFPDQVICNGVTSHGALDHYRGALDSVLGRHDEAVHRLSGALAVHEGLGAPFFEARSCLELGKALRARGQGDDGARATELWARARAVAEAHGYTGVARRTRALAGV